MIEQRSVCTLKQAGMLPSLGALCSSTVLFSSLIFPCVATRVFVLAILSVQEFSSNSTICRVAQENGRNHFQFFESVPEQAILPGVWEFLHTAAQSGPPIPSGLVSQAGNCRLITRVSGFRIETTGDINVSSARCYPDARINDS